MFHIAVRSGLNSLVPLEGIIMPESSVSFDPNESMNDHGLKFFFSKSWVEKRFSVFTDTLRQKMRFLAILKPQWHLTTAF